MTPINTNNPFEKLLNQGSHIPVISTLVGITRVIYDTARKVFDKSYETHYKRAALETFSFLSLGYINYQLAKIDRVSHVKLYQSEESKEEQPKFGTYEHVNKQGEKVRRNYLQQKASDGEVGRLEYRVDLDEKTASNSYKKEFNRAQDAMNGQQGEVEKVRKLGERWVITDDQEPQNIFDINTPQDRFTLKDGFLFTKSEMVKPHGLDAFTGGHCEAKGRRDAQEDAHYSGQIEVSIAGQKKKMNIAAVFDGHGGAQASKYAAENLPRVMKNLWERFCKDGVTAAGSKNAQKLTTVTLDDEVYEKGIRDGSTANILAMLDNTLYASNLGDSRSLMVGPDGAVTALSRDMKIKDDMNSIENRRLHVWNSPSGPRHARSGVNVARTIGDYRGSKVGPSARPKLVRIQKDDWKGHYGIIVCDGISDVMTTEEIGTFVHERIKMGWSEKQIALGLVAVANTHYYSTDNLSAMVINLESMAN